MSGRRNEERDAHFVALYREHFATLLPIARLLSNNEHEATRLVLETFVSLAVDDGPIAIENEGDDVLRALLRLARRGGRTAGRRPSAEYSSWASISTNFDHVDRALHALSELSARQRECVVLR